MPEPTHPHRDAELWTGAAGHVAEHIIREYSSSFWLGSRLLPPPVRRDIAHLYAVVRIADEIVDGAAAEAGLSPDEIRDTLDEYEEQVCSAPQRPFHTDPVLHAYAETARRCRFDEHHLRAFFRSMRMDIQEEPAHFSDEEIREYIYGSAEVIGLLCLAVFDAASDARPSAPSQRAILETGAASLGAAFQKINFLRDIGKDYEHLGRRYLPGCGQYPPAAEDIRRVIDEIDEDLNTARIAIPLLPPSCQPAVWSVTRLFEELTARLSRTPPEEILRSRVRISGPEKLRIAAMTLLRGQAIRNGRRSR